MIGSICSKRMSNRIGDMRLPDDLLEGLWPIPAIQGNHSESLTALQRYVLRTSQNPKHEVESHRRYRAFTKPASGHSHVFGIPREKLRTAILE